MNEEVVILHPRPTPIAAAMYTLRDLDADIIILHGPSGCCFRASRLMERDGVRVITTAMEEKDFIFGAYKRLVKVLRRVDELFHPKLVGVVGTCVSMIIGEDLKRAAKEANIGGKILAINIHSGSGDNTVGAITTLETAAKAHLINIEEFERQKRMLELATKLERKRGTARKEYIEMSRGDSHAEVARLVVERLRAGGRVGAVLNAKKETAFVFADVLLALNQAQRAVGGSVVNLANLDAEVGLPRIKRYARQILSNLEAEGVSIHHTTGGLDEYPVSGERAGEILKGLESLEMAVVSGIVHAVPVERDMVTVGVAVGTRAVGSLKSLGYTHVLPDVDAHASGLARSRIALSRFGEAIRKSAGVASRRSRARGG